MELFGKPVVISNELEPISIKEPAITYTLDDYYKFTHYYDEAEKVHYLESATGCYAITDDTWQAMKARHDNAAP